ncbi:hypothetical protein OG586_22365 [Streptomyces murinus]|uniref:hypothetical protein n=1 Tax=Streptomyces murinus TaxID=33900 RepID=UPI002E80CE8C|nr:hypothetical protein [Streptomyces murinus]WUD08782.1 hypothetical protein OG586_22365 [Streptomyces murinus]
MQSEAVGGGLFDHVRGREDVEEAPGGARVDIRERRRGRIAEVRTRVQPEQPEEPGGIRRQRPIGPCEHGTHRLGFVAVVCCQRFPPAGIVTQLADQIRQGHQGLSGGALGGDSERQWQARTQGGEFRHQRGVVSVPVPRDDAAQQGDRTVLAEHVQGEAPGSFPDGQPGQPVSAGHDDQASRCRGQQWPDLGRTDGVVEHEQEPAVGEP